MKPPLADKNTASKPMNSKAEGITQWTKDLTSMEWGLNNFPISK